MICPGSSELGGMKCDYSCIYFKLLIMSIAIQCMCHYCSVCHNVLRHQDIQVLATGGGIVFTSFTASFSGWDACGVLKGQGHGL